MVPGRGDWFTALKAPNGPTQGGSARPSVLFSCTQPDRCERIPGLQSSNPDQLAKLFLVNDADGMTLPDQRLRIAKLIPLVSVAVIRRPPSLDDDVDLGRYAIGDPTAGLPNHIMEHTRVRLAFESRRFPWIRVKKRRRGTNHCRAVTISNGIPRIRHPRSSSVGDSECGGEARFKVG